MDVDTRVLRYFVAVAEQMSFTAASKIVFVSQPALSRQMSRFETDLGTALFERNGREVRLTAAGTAMLTAAREILGLWQSAKQTTRAVAAAKSNILRVGFEATGAGALGTRACIAFSERHPEITIEPRRYDWGGEAEALREGAVDVAFLWLPADTTNLRYQVVATEPRVIGMPVTHPLAVHDKVGIMSMRDEPVMWTRKAPRDWVDWWAVNPRPDGRQPCWGPPNDNVEEMLESVAAGAGICISPLSMSVYYTRPDLVWRRIPDISPLRIAIAWADANTDPLVTEFVQLVRRLSQHPA